MLELVIGICVVLVYGLGYFAGMRSGKNVGYCTGWADGWNRAEEIERERQKRMLVVGRKKVKQS